MQKLTATLIICFALQQALAQPQRRVNAYLLTQYNNTIYDATPGNNPWSIGVGLQAFFYTNTIVIPIAEITVDAYLADDKVGRLNSGGNIQDDLGGMINVFIGASVNPVTSINLSFSAGPSFINGKVYTGIKPSAGFYFSKNKRWMGKISYINIFNRDKISGEDFGSVSIGIGLKLF